MIDNPFSLLSWRDGLEIVVVATVFYKISLWLKADQHKNLLPILYGYCILFLSSYSLQLPILSTLLLAFTPALIMIFILIHQKTLQKNFIALKTINPAQITSDDWIEVVIRTSLVSMSKKRQLIYVIERNHSLAEFVEQECPVNAELHKPLLDIILESGEFDQTKFLLINSNGQILSANTSWKIIEHDWMSNEVRETTKEQQAAIAMTGKTDALVIFANSQAKSLTLIIGGTIVDQLNAAQLFTLLKKYLRSHTTSHKKGELSHASQSQKHSVEQQQS